MVEELKEEVYSAALKISVKRDWMYQASFRAKSSRS